MFNQLVSLIERVDDSPHPPPAQTVTTTLEETTREAPKDVVAIDMDQPLAIPEEHQEKSDDRPDAPKASETTTPIVAAVAGTIADVPREIERLARQLAAAESERDAYSRNCAMLQSTVEMLQEKLNAKDTILRRITWLEQNENSQGGETASREKEELSGQAKTIMQDERDRTIDYLQRMAQHHVSVIDRLSNEARESRAEQIAALTALSIATSSAQRSDEKCSSLTDELQVIRSALSSVKKENVRLTSRIELLKSTMEKLEGEAQRLRTELDAATAQIVRRDAELSLVKQYSFIGTSEAPLQQQRSDHSTAREAVGYRIRTLASAFDVIVVRIGRLLRVNVKLRLVAAMYILVLHVYVFNAMMLLLHHTSVLPDHAGSDVHDHIANHLHHG